jgi:chemotaxis protein methyltransferase CheR
VSDAALAGALERISAVVQERAGIVIGPDKLYLVETRLEPIMRSFRLGSLAELADRLRRPDGERLARDVVEAMTTNESLFFRDDKPFVHVRAEVLPQLLTQRSRDASLRVWSAAASTGQEAYSLAMCMVECAGMLAGRRVEIVGTDIAREPLSRAREGLYTQFEMQRGLPMQYLVKYFAKEGSHWRISPALRAMVQFREWNLLGDLRPLGRFDIVFCRNVLIYFDAPTKTRVLEAIAHQINPDGVLYLGGAETVLGVTARFAPIPGQRGVYGLAAYVKSLAAAA